MIHEQALVRTRDGTCPVHTFTAGENAAALLFYMDAGGLRPTILQMAERLSSAGYLVLVPDLYYRFGPYGPYDPADVFQGDFRAILGPLMATTSNAKAADDTEALLAYLDNRCDVPSRAVAAVGFCMGGGMAIAAAGTYPDRIKAVTSFHGGNLATQSPDSPHLFAPRIQAEVEIAAAENDDSFPREMARRLEVAFDEAGVRHRTRIYPAAHGWMLPDFPVYDEVAAEAGWQDMLSFLGRTVG